MRKTSITMTDEGYLSFVRWLRLNALCQLDGGANLRQKALFYSQRLAYDLFVSLWIFFCLMDIVKRERFELMAIAINVLNLAVSTNSLIRMNYFYVFGGEAGKLIRKLRAVFVHETQTGLEEKTVGSYVRLVRQISVFWPCLGLFSTELFMLVTPWTSKSAERHLPVPQWYPYDWQVSPYYQMTYFIQLVTQGILASLITATDVFFVCTVILAAGQFELLGWEFRNLLYKTLLKCQLAKEDVLEFKNSFNARENGDSLNAKASNRAMKKVNRVMATRKFNACLIAEFNGLLITHNELLSFCCDLEEFFSPMLLPGYMILVFVLMFSAFIIDATDDISFIASISQYTLACLTEAFLFNYYGYLATVESEKLPDDLYESPWYMCSSKFKTSFKIVHVRLGKPVLLTAGKFVKINLETYLWVIKTSISYFAVLRQVTGQDN